MKPWFKSKTLWLNAAAALIAGIDAAQAFMTGNSSMLNPRTAPWLLAGLAIANFALRLVTSQPIGGALDGK